MDKKISSQSSFSIMSHPSFSLTFILDSTCSHLIQKQAEHFTNITIDGRQAKPNALFVAISGPNHDGHHYIEQAVAQGATGVLVQSGRGTDIAKTFRQLTVIEVQDAQKALGQLASAYRQSPDIAQRLKVIGITGSYGKTTTKEMLAEILKAHTQDPSQVLYTEGNLNNHFGVPLTLLRLTPHHLYAVIEMGMSDLGEIAYLTSLAKPEIGMITSVGPAHLETLKTIENVAKAKGELFFGLPNFGKAIFLDQPSYKLIKKQAEQAGVTEGRISAVTASLDRQNEQAAIYVELLSEQFEGIRFRFFIKNEGILKPSNPSLGGTEVFLPLLGAHQVENAALAITAALCLGVSSSVICEGLAKVKPHKHRGERLSYGGRLIVDDCYNANPESVKAALKTLGSLKREGRAFMILGDMLELGEQEKTYHHSIGEFAAGQPISGVFTLGERAKAIALAASAKGVTASHHTSIEDLANALIKTCEPGDIFWVKGSRGMQLERLYPLLKEAWQSK